MVILFFSVDIVFIYIQVLYARIFFVLTYFCGICIGRFDGGSVRSVGGGGERGGEKVEEEEENDGD